eukprot:TRINITY_DN2079_c0_g1_i3.p1 TRINITY_DN2079_c0_g1~~TRINITY_DN2079_c0_g1_i3.p1  ORF type:complete len:174 (+),score=73.24 TRINITY_DN2079_c0_g1_i3:161-682(+)
MNENIILKKRKNQVWLASVSLDSLSVIFHFSIDLIQKMKKRKKEWLKWRLVSHDIQEMVDRIYLKCFGNKCKSTQSFIEIPHLFTSLKIDSVSKETIESIAEVLKYNTSLTSLDIKGSQIGEEGMKWMGETLKYNTSLRMGETLKCNTSLTSLQIRYTGIKKEGMGWLGEGLK